MGGYIYSLLQPGILYSLVGTSETVATPCLVLWVYRICIVARHDVFFFFYHIPEV
jgi:hypothetical protein